SLAALVAMDLPVVGSLAASVASDLPVAVDNSAVGKVGMHMLAVV
ncbi:hypothetical protein PMI05_05551, partial [Brevibacillus sp. BC25]